MSYDITGLYEGVERITLRVSENRFIEPEPSADEARILFLGGSTTESLYVPEAMRWVALLGGYNAGMSSANMLDKINTLRYLSERGDRFDLIVHMTALNDAAWSARLGDKFNVSDYPDALSAFYLANPPPQPNGTVLDAYLSQYEVGTFTLEACDSYEEFLTQFSASMDANFRLLKETAAATNTPLLILSEATSYGADASSFTHDLRTTPICDGKRLSPAAAVQYFHDVNVRYLAAAEAVGLETFDLAESIRNFTNGENGGHYIYDNMHFTPAGSELVAETLREVLRTRYSYYS